MPKDAFVRKISPRLPSCFDWIIELGMENYHPSNERIIVGDLGNALAINSIILITKKGNLQRYEERTKTQYP